jgi:hypothetical protein
VAEEGLVPADAPYQFTVEEAATFSCDQSVAYSGGAPLMRVKSNPAPGQYAVAAGVYLFNAADAGVALDFSYGTVAIPADILDVALQVITSRYASKNRDPLLVQQDTPGIGLQRWWIGTTPGQNSPFPPDLEGILQPYQMPVVV